MEVSGQLSHPEYFTPREKAPSTNAYLGSKDDLDIVEKRKISRTPVIQPVVRRYTD
jgi:hypothetical protein